MDVRSRILAIYDEITKLEEEKKALFAELQAGCPHEHIVYRDWFSTPYLGIFHDYWMICLVCGFENEGGAWQYELPEKCYGGKKSKFKTAIKVGKDEIFKYRRLHPLEIVETVSPVI